MNVHPSMLDVPLSLKYKKMIKKIAQSRQINYSPLNINSGQYRPAED